MRTNIVINDNVFGNGVSCPIIVILYCNALNPKHVILAHNTFENCQHLFNWNSIVNIRMQYHSVEIVNNLFTNLYDNS